MQDKKQLNKNARLSRAKKEANDKAWYKEQLDSLETFSLRGIYDINGISDYDRMRTNYDLFNNIIEPRDFEYVCKPFGAEEGELPARLTNKDIISNKIKAVLGIEAASPFDYKVLAVNSDATTRKEQEEFGRIKEFVYSQIMVPIQQQIELQAQQETLGRELTAEERQQIEQQVQEQLQAATPQEVKEYMKRKHQDPAEVLGHRLLEYLSIKLEMRDVFNEGMKDVCIAAKEIYYVGQKGEEPYACRINPLRFNHDLSPDQTFIEDGDWATYEYRMNPSEVINFFPELKTSDIDELFNNDSNYLGSTIENRVHDYTRTEHHLDEREANTIRVIHGVWKSLRELKILKYQDLETGEILETIVDEYYELNPEIGDIDIKVLWIPEVYEGYKIGSSVYTRLRPVPGQFKDLDTINESKLPYYGAVYDATNSVPTSLVDRGKSWQYYFDIAFYRLELVMASDKGKKVLMNINTVPDDAEMGIKEFQYFFESTPFGWLNPNQEGSGYNDVNTSAKVIDLSTASDIAKYIEILNFIKQECGEAMGVSKAMEAQVKQGEAVTNTQQNLIQNSYILESLFSLHSRVKKNVLNALLEKAKIIYSRKKPQKLSYILDDLSLAILDLDPELLENSTLGLFVNDSTKASEIKQVITQLAHAALQNQQAKLSDVITILKEESITVAEEKLRQSEEDMQEYELRKQRETLEIQERMQKAQAEEAIKEHEREKEIVVLKEEERRKTVIAQAALTGMSFNPDSDTDRDGVNDFLEIAKHGVDANVKMSKQQLEREKFEHQKQQDKTNNDIAKQKLSIDRQKANKSSSSN